MFARFKSGDFYLNDKDCSGRPIEVSDSVLEQMLEEDPHQLNRDLAIKLNCSSTPVLNRFKSRKWVLYKLSEKNMNQRFTNCISLSSRQKIMYYDTCHST